MMTKKRATRMRLHTFVIDENKRRSGRRRDLLNRSFHVWIRKGPDDESVAEFGGQLVLTRPRPEFSVRFHVGNAGSETPFDGHITVLGSGLYLNMSLGRRFAQWATTSEKHKYDGRDVSVRASDGRLWLNMWVPADRWSRGEFAPWRTATVPINPADLIWGRASYRYRDVEKRTVALVLPEGEYPVELTMQRQTFGRPKSKRQARSWSVSWSAPRGIPSHYDSSGGWKGDRTYGSGFSIADLTADRDDWDVDALASLGSWVLKERARTGFRRAQVEAGAEQ